MSQLLISLKTNNNNSTAGHESVFNSEYSYLCLPSTLWHTMGTPRHTRDVTLWLSRTTDNSNFFIGSREVRDNECRLYVTNIPTKLYISMMFDDIHLCSFKVIAETHFDL